MEIKRDNAKVLQTLKNRFEALASVQGKTGWFEVSKYDDGTPVASVAAQNEFGDPEKNIPARPTMRPAAIEKKNELNQVTAQAAKQVIAGKITAKDAMDRITYLMENAIAKNITALTSPPLSPVTIEIRKSKGNTSTKPLIDSGKMLQQLSSIVEDANT